MEAAADKLETLVSLSEEVLLTPGGGGGGGGPYSSMIWGGMCRWDLKNRPIYIPNFAEKWDPFVYQSHKF